MCIGSSEGCHLHLWCSLPIVGMQRPSSETLGGSNPKHKEHMLSRPWPPDGRLETRHQNKTIEVWQPKRQHNLNFGTQKWTTKVHFAGPTKDLIPKKWTQLAAQKWEFWRPGMSPEPNSGGKTWIQNLYQKLPTLVSENWPVSAPKNGPRTPLFGARNGSILRAQNWPRKIVPY